MITIINYGMGNLGSVQNMLKRIGMPSVITSDIREIEKAEKVLLPGVGSFDAAVRRIDELGLRQVLYYKAIEQKVPFLGICLGMQLLTRNSEEGPGNGLGYIPAATVKFEFKEQTHLKIPHMGWNFVRTNQQSQITEGFTDDYRFYFVHSYKVVCDHPEHVVLRTDYGGWFDSAVQKDNIYGAQFHPEKSHRYGMHLLKNFSKI
ncbi:MAG: imidazole glycerol phosphate synthase subunit HisH [Bacteroidetes bacterium]|nr:imidazole glycerol phosphate synthase subunit HisH [Bacteroidota bacterium]